MWIKRRISEYDFIENQYFVKLHKKMELSKTGQIAIEYFILLARVQCLLPHNTARRLFFGIGSRWRLF